MIDYRFRDFSLNEEASPCLGCNNREIGCHIKGHCRDYDEYQVRANKAKEIRYRANDELNFHLGIIEETKRRTK